MLVHKRRPGQGIIFDGLLRVTVEEITPEVWLAVESQPAGVAPVISAFANRVAGKVRVGIRSPASLHVEPTRTTVTTAVDGDPDSQLILARHPGEVIDVDGISIELAELEGGEHNGKPLLRITAPGLADVVELAVLTRYNYAVDIATAAPQAVRIYRTEVWAPAANANEEAASWTNDATRALEHRSAKTA